MRPPFFQEGGSLEYPLGTDNLGRDQLSRLLVGTRISLQVGFVVVVISGIMGSTIALLAGYLGGWVDTLLGRLTDTMLYIANGETAEQVATDSGESSVSGSLSYDKTEIVSVRICAGK